ncbi:MAG TPA: peptide ABC transporter substrate-binding protein [Verrucomicrobiota bacterium]|nr:peptide ABC transporter substrate-binding protein [Verrucomicrobiota bacterium]HNU49620.1 peptide ABC transporter substrate-binding protein [Verrucomicrobiota bacterium]
MRRRGAVVLKAAALGSLLGVWGLLSGCGPARRPADLVIINGAEPESLDPHVVTGQADGRIASTLFEGLTRFDPVEARPVPGLAARWEVSPDGKAYTFHLRTNAAWSTGEPILAEDFVWSWKRILSPETAAEYVGVLFYLRNGEAYATGRLQDFSRVGVRAEGARVLRVELESPTPFFLDLCSFQPYAVVPRQRIERHGDRWLHARPFMASGAYTLESWRLNDRVRLRRNPHYWDAAAVQSEVVDMLSCVVPATALNLYETRAVDIIWDKELMPLELMDRMRQRPDFHAYPSLGNYFIRVNVTKAPYLDSRVRRALAQAIDKERIVRKILRGGERVARTVSPPGIANGPLIYQPPEGLPHDPPAARQLLAEAGFPEGRGFPTLVYTYNTQESHRKIGVELQEMWGRELGLRVELRQLEWKTYLRAQHMLDYDLIRSSWVGDYNDPNTFLDLFMSDNPNNRTGWRNARYDQAVRAANAETKPERRQERLREAEAILVETELPVIPVFFYVGMELYDPARVTGIHSNLRSEHALWAIRRVDRGGAGGGGSGP